MMMALLLSQPTFSQNSIKSFTSLEKEKSQFFFDEEEEEDDFDKEEPEEEEEAEEEEDEEEAEEDEAEEEDEEEEPEEEEKEDDDKDDDEDDDEDKPRKPKAPKKTRMDRKDRIPGLLESFVKLIELDKKKFVQKFNNIKAITEDQQERKIGLELEIDPDYMTSALFYTPHKYAQLAFKNKCSLFDLLQTGLLGTYVESDDVMLRTVDQNDKMISLTIPRDDYLGYVFSRECQQSRNLKRLFNPPLLKQVMKRIQFEIPNDRELCLGLHEKLVNDIKTPYYCQILNDISEGVKAEGYLPYAKRNSLKIVGELREKIKRGKELRSSISDSQMDYIKMLCSNIETPKTFCEGFFDKSFWTRIIQNERSPYYATYFCQDLLGRANINKRSLKICLEKMIQDQDLCHYIGKRYPSLTPKPNCENISRALNHSRLFSHYKDCPGKTGNEGVLNISRVIKHFRGRNEKIYNTLCSLTSAAEFVEFNLKNDNEQSWGVSLCYEDPIKAQTVCLPSIMGIFPESQYSEDKVLADIMSRTRGTSPTMKCEATPEQVYRSVLLKYKSGCHIIYDWFNCTAVDCKQRVFYNGKEVTHIKQKGDLTFSYYPTDYKDENYAQTTTLNRGFTGKKHKKVENLTLLNFYMKQSKKAIIHGIGCAEDLLPSFFQKDAFYQCKPLPFIIDGTIKNEGKTSLIVRTALDDLHAPRIVDWNHIFTAVKNYSEKHPAKVWTLDAFY
jgi:hypothetical protein